MATAFELNPLHRRRKRRYRSYRRRRNYWKGNSRGHRQSSFVRWYGRKHPPKWMRRLARLPRTIHSRRRKHSAHRSKARKTLRLKRGFAAGLPTAASKGFFATNPWRGHRRHHRRWNPSHAMRRRDVFKNLTAGFHVSALKPVVPMAVGVAGNIYLAPIVSNLLPVSFRGGWKDSLTATFTAGAMLLVPKYGRALFSGAMLQVAISTIESYRAGTLFGPPPPTPAQIAAAQAQAAARAKAAQGTSGLASTYSPDMDSTGMLGLDAGMFDEGADAFA